MNIIDEKKNNNKSPKKSQAQNPKYYFQLILYF